MITTPEGSSFCESSDLAAYLREAQPDLSRVGITRVVCEAGDEEIVRGPFDALEVSKKKRAQRRRRARNRSVLLAIERDTDFDIAVIGDQLLMTGGSDSSECIQLRWTDAIREHASRLRERGISRAACRADSFVVWSGPLDALPETSADTTCAEPVARWHSDASTEVPAPCNWATQTKTWHGQAAAAAERGDCKTVRELTQKIRRAHPAYMRERLDTDVRLAACRSTD